MAGSPAEKAGLKKDDLILAVGSDTVRSVREYQKFELKLRPGQQLNFIVKRKNTIQRFSVKVGTKKKKPAE